MKTPRRAKTQKQRSRSAGAESGSSASSEANDSAFVVPYKAYAVARDGSRSLIDARSVVVEISDGEVEFELEAARPLLRGQLRVRVNGLLIIGHADASS